MEEYDDIDRILNELDADSMNDEMNDEFGDAYDDPDNFDFGFERERSENGFANFDFDPEEAKQMQKEELDRIRESEGHVEDDNDYTEVEDDGYSY